MDQATEAGPNPSEEATAAAGRTPMAGKGAAPAASRPDWIEPAAVYLTAAFTLTGSYFLARGSAWPAASRFLASVLYEREFMGELAAFALGSVFFYVVPPAIVTALILKRSPASIGLGLGSLPRHAWVYAALLAGVLPMVWLSSLKKDFLYTYPFDVRIGQDWRFFLAWEIMYCAQFLGLEYFFRGFLLFPLEKRLGSAAVFVMTVPYAMLHFQKPFLEANAAVFAGLILGFMALRTRSIWGGVTLHCSVAVTMDSLALYRHGMWPPG